MCFIPPATVPAPCRGDQSDHARSGARRRALGRRLLRGRVYSRAVSREIEQQNRRLLRTRDAMDRTYAEPLDITGLARVARVSESHFIRTFRSTFGETPHRYLQRRRVERSMFLLRETDKSVTDICMEVGCTSLGTFSRTFRNIVGLSPVAYRRGSEPARTAVPTCFTMAWMRPSSFGEDGDAR
jgi:AraC-like DNA-binding protein